MQVEVIYNQGQIEFAHPIRLKHDHIRLLVTVPDEEIDSQDPLLNLPADVLRRSAEMRKRLDAIRQAPLPPDDQLPAVSAKTLERMEAYELRSKMRVEQGRPG